MGTEHDRLPIGRGLENIVPAAPGQVVEYIAKPGPGYTAPGRKAYGSPPIRLAPGQSIDSDRFMLNVASSPHAALEEYADAMGATHNARSGRGAPGTARPAVSMPT